jgi:hypothetical protein
MPLGLLMKLDNPGVEQPNTIAVHDSVPVHPEDCKAYRKIGRETIVAHRKDSMEGTFETVRIYTSDSRKWSDKSLSSQVYL